MSTGKLLWGCLWRATAYGAGLGTGLGAIYGAVSVPLFAAVMKLIEEEGPEKLTAAVSYFVGTFVSYGPPIGFLVGMLVIGPLMGLLLGPLNGLFLFVVLRAFPPGRSGGFLSSRRALAWAACLLTAAVAVAVVGWVTLNDILYLLSNPWLNTTPGTRGGIRPNELAHLMTMEAMPAFIAVLAMRWADGKVVGWYEREVSGAERDDQAPADSERPARG